MGALAYLEWRFAVHHATAIARSPLRLAIWIPYLFSIAAVAYARISAPHHQAFLSVGLPYEISTAVGGLYLGTLGVSVGLAAGGRVAAFRSAGEAVLFVNAGVRPLGIAIWLQVRKVAAGWSRWISALTYVFLIAIPAHVGPVAVVRIFVASLLALAVHMSSELPAFLVARGRLRTPVRVAGWSLAAAGFVCAAASLAGPRIHRTLATAGLDPGAGVSAIFRGDPGMLVLLGALLALCVVAIVLLGDDAIPELYAASVQAAARRSARSPVTAQLGFAAPAQTQTVTPRVPAGALALLWKDWIAFRRGRGTLGVWLAGTAFWALCGAVTAFAAKSWNDLTPLATLLSMSAVIVVLSASFGAARGLGAELTKPLFWLSADPLRARLGAWTLGRAVRGGIAIGSAPFAAGIVSGDASLAAGALPLAIVSYWSLQCLGLALFALFPSPVDTRGPLTLVRLVLTALYLAPAVLLAGAAAATWAENALPAALVFALVLTLEGAGTVEFTARVLGQNGASTGRRQSI
jgi:hypothetical protein